MDMVGISSFSLQRWRSPSLEIAALVRFPLDELHLLWMSKLPNLLLFLGGMIDINPSICINLNLVPIGVDSNQIKLQHTTSLCTLYKYTYIYIYAYIHIITSIYTYIYLYTYMYYVSLVSTCIRSKSKTSFIKGPGGSRSPWPQIWRHGNSAMPLRAADEVIHTECFSLKWRRLNPEVKSKGYLILHAACITSTPSCSDRRKRRTQCHSVGPRGYSELGGTLQH